MNLNEKISYPTLVKNGKKEFIDIGINDFLEVQETLQLQDYILKKLEDMDANNTYIISQEDDFLAEFTQVLLSKIDEEQMYVFFTGEANEIGALMLKGDVILEKCGYIIKKSELFNKGCSIFFCHINMESGICFWKGEYDNRIYIW